MSSYYGDVSSYRRIENGSRFPERDAAIAILVRGLGISEVSKVDTLLAVAGYEAVTASETNDLGLTPDAFSSEYAPPPQQTPASSKTHPKTSRDLNIAVAGVCASLVIGTAICSKTEYGRWFGLLLSVMYAGLYLTSLLLESAYEPQTRRRPVLAGVFSLLLVSSSVALAADGSMVNSGTGGGLAVALIVFALAGGLQAFISRRALPDYPVVKGRYLMHTAQSAHVKNTGYFLLIVILFWLPPLHAVTILRREMRLGHSAFVRETMRHWMLLGHGIISPNYGVLIGLLITMAIISLPMRTQLLDNLRPHPKQNSYLHLFYIRALVYFSLSGTCVVWYVYAIGSLLDQLG